jgi:DNA-directed RNA polymerase I, II, and III subunit RPABC2
VSIIKGSIDPKRDRKEVAKKITIGPPRLTRFERARIIGARALQLALGAPPFVPVTTNVSDPITLAMIELDAKALPISIRRTLPDGRYQDIPIDVLLN